MRKYLLITEGKEKEFDVLTSIFCMYDNYHIIEGNLKNKTGKNEINRFMLLENEKTKIYIVQSPQSRLYNVLKDVKKFEFILPNLYDFGEYGDKYPFSGIYCLYDVDHNSNETLEEAIDKLSIREEGLLLISCPCIEVLYDENYKPYKINNKIKEYKSYANINTDNKISIEEHLIRVLKHNYEIFKEDNILLHPQLVVKKIIENHSILSRGEGENYGNDEIIFDFLTTVIYVAVGDIFNVTRKENNYMEMIQFLQNCKINKNNQTEKIENK